MYHREWNRQTYKIVGKVFREYDTIGYDAERDRVNKPATERTGLGPRPTAHERFIEWELAND